MKKVLIIMLFIFPLVVNAKGIKVDGVTYLTPSEAEEAIKDGSTVVLEEDFVDEDTNSWQNINIMHSNVTIDLNNHKINSIYMIPPVPESQNNTSAVIKNGTIENFEQGKQKFLRESPASTSYQKYMKTFDTLYKNLIALLPKEDQGNDDGWDNDEI